MSPPPGSTLEDRLRDVLQRVAEATPIDDRPMRPSAQRRPTQRLALVAAVVLLVVVGLVAGVLALQSGDDGRQQTTVTTPTPEAGPRLGPLPYLVVGEGRLGSVIVSHEIPATTERPPWWSQTYAADDIYGPALHILTLPAGDGPKDDINATYATARTTGVSVQGSPARLLEEMGVVSLWWPGGGPDGTILTARGLTVDELVAVADGLRTRDSEGWEVTSIPASLSPVSDEPRESLAPEMPQWSLMAQVHDVEPLNGPALLRIFTAGRGTIAASRAEMRGLLEPVTIAHQPGHLLVRDQDVWLLWEPVPGVQAELWLTMDDADAAVGRAVAASVAVVTEEAWFAALPDDALDAEAQAALFAETEDGTPLPAGISMADVRATVGMAGHGADRREVVASEHEIVPRLANVIGCMWAGTWADATERGDSARAQAAIAALRGSTEWSVVRRFTNGLTIGDAEAGGQLMAIWIGVVQAGNVAAAREAMDGTCA